MFNILLCTTGYEIVILVTPPSAKPNTPGLKCYCFSRKPIGDKPANVFYEVSPDEAKSHFVAYHERTDIVPSPLELFVSVEEAQKFVVAKILERQLEAELRHRDIDLHNE